MKNHLRIALALLPVGGACCLSASTAQEIPHQIAGSTPRSATAKLLQEFLGCKYFWQQAEAGDKLVALGDKSVVPALLPLLKSQDRRLRCNVGRVLAGLGDDRGFFAALAELQDARPGTARKTESRTSDGKRPDILRQMWQDRYYAALVLGQIGDDRAVPALIETLQDPSINYQAAMILGKLGDKRAIPALREALTKAKSQRQAQNMDMKLWSGYGLMLLGDPIGLPTVAAVLQHDPNWNQRRHAAELLALSGDKKAVPLLIASLHDKEVNVRLCVVRALGKLGDERAIPALKAMLGDNAVNTTWTPTTIAEAATQAIKQIDGSTTSAWR